MALLLANRPLGRNAGAKMLWCVAGFGVATILFGLSHSMVLSMVALILVGATDMVSVVIRGILIQLFTPNAMRGRVNAVDMIFIGTSNELGGIRIGIDRATHRHGSRSHRRRHRRDRGNCRVRGAISRAAKAR